MNQIIEVATMEPELTEGQLNYFFNHYDDKLKEAGRIRETLLPALERLSKREQKIINSVFFDAETETSVAKREGVSKTRINQIKRKALSKLRYIMMGGM